MKGFTAVTARLIMVVKRVYEQKWRFCSVFVLVFLGSVSFLGYLGVLPEVAAVNSPVPEVTLGSRVAAVAEAIPSVTQEAPERIVIPTIGVDTTIANPTTANIVTLDKLLLKGAVRYPTSAKLGETGNVVLFGHSSYLPVVLNQAYKAFNNIQKLVAGDVITVYSSGTVYTYHVRTVAHESTNSAGIALSVTGRVLTLTTCDSFGAKTDRFVVTADFVESHSLPS